MNLFEALMNLIKSMAAYGEVCLTSRNEIQGWNV